MKQETNNEMDLLLRRLGRRQSLPTSNGDSQNQSEHLDADELSSYAENVLPAAARARYTEHLAECSRCRQLVVQLSGSVPVVAAKETTPAMPSGLAKFLAGLFSPMVLRYAVPALVLIVAAGIGFVALRSDRRGSSVAELRPQADSTAKSNEQPMTYTSPSADAQARRGAESPAAEPPRRSDVSKDTDAPAPPNAAPVVGSVRVEPKVDASTQKAEEQAAVANPTPAPAQPAAPKPAETVDEMRVEAEGQRANRQRATTEVARENTSVLTPAGRKKSDEASDKRPAKTAATASPAQGARSTGTFQMRDGETDLVTRSVAGRRFRKVSGVWVDTAYAAGSATTNIGRGSEQYRALIADEPEIKTIAEQLDGQIIVVWKGRAYRIR